MPYIIDGKVISKQIKDELRDEVEKINRGRHKCLPCSDTGGK